MNEIVDSLQKIGLSDKEARIYLALLKIGDATVKDIAAEAGIKRPTTYLVLEDLRQKGLILKIPHAKKAVYQAKNADELYGYASENMSALKRAIPKMEALQTERNPVKTYYFEGLQGLKDALFYRIDEQRGKQLSGFWAKDAGFSESVIDLFMKFGNALKKRDVSMAGITPDHESVKRYKENYPESFYHIKLVPEADYSSEISIDATDDFVRILDGVEMKAVIIESKRAANAVKQILDLVKKGIEKN